MGKKNVGNLKHGGAGTRLYCIWQGLKSRCLRPRHHDYQHYGGKGITLCQEWASGFSSFKAWAEVNGYRDDLSLDRIDGTKGYSPENCRWATIKQQNRNKRTNVVVEGKCLSEWAETAVVPYQIVRDRVRHGWSIQDACNVPKRGKRHAA